MNDQIRKKEISSASWQREKRQGKMRCVIAVMMMKMKCNATGEGGE